MSKQETAAKLRALQQSIQQQQQEMEELQLQLKAEAFLSIDLILTEHSITTEELVFHYSKPKSFSNPTKGKKIPPKYSVDGKHWSGRGQKPQFIVDYLSRGGKLEDIAITN